MSHYCAYVFSRSPKDVDTLLAPYTENVDPGDEYAEFKEDEEYDVDKITGRKGYWHNPNACWDWYSKGGRFCDSLKLKIGEFTTCARVVDCDFSHDQKAYAEAVARWEEIVERHNAEASFWKPEYYTERYGTKERYAESCSSAAPYAFVTADGKWYETGHMGWFAIDDASPESIDVYHSTFREYLKYAAQENLFVTVIDCHI